ncbi:MAG: hypothetical protein R3360_06660, partial [Alphaproteobacteria bacterium]|nr:hypothetical protein [Alphaproteobacteria bacterium]
ALAQKGQEQVVQMILNITRGSMATPGGIGYLAIARTRMEEIELAQEDTSQVAEALEPMGDTEKMGLIRAVASISASVSVARENAAASANVKKQGQNVIDTADRVLETAQTLQSLSISGTEADKRASLIGALGAELHTLEREVQRLASGEGLMTPQPGN